MHSVFRGHQNANLDPLGLWQRDRVRDLEFLITVLEDETRSR